MPVWLNDILYLLGGLIGGLIIGFFVARTLMKKQLKDNPPVNEKMIRAMMSSMGRQPSQKQVNQVMKNMNKFQ